MFAFFRSSSLWEKLAIGALTLVVLVSGVQIGDAFVVDNSDVVPASGGTFIEGVVGEYRYFNPVLAQTDLDRDVTKLLFCGLQKFDPVQNTVVDDVATHALSPDKRTYTFALKDGAVWHDGQPVTADDVMFTYHDVIQSPLFQNAALASDFVGVQMAKVDDKTVTMTLAKPNAFFVYTTTVGLLPKHLLGGTPVDQLAGLGDYNVSQPIGCGPYKMEQATGNQIRLSAFDGYYGGRPKLDTFLFRIFPSAEVLFKNISSVNGTEDLTSDEYKSLATDNRLHLHEFSLPQYVAVFFNTQKPQLKDSKTRLGLQLATDKKAIGDSVKNVRVIDTPFLEIDAENWQYTYSGERADGALYDAGWHYAQKTSIPDGTVVAPSANGAGGPAALSPNGRGGPDSGTPAASASAAGDLHGAAPDSPASPYITQPTGDRYYATDSGDFMLGGNVPDGTTSVSVNGYSLSKYVRGQRSWSYRASTQLHTLADGQQEYTVVFGKADGSSEMGKLMVFREQNADTRQAWLDKKHAQAAAAGSGAVQSTPDAATTPAVPTTTDAAPLGAPVTSSDAAVQQAAPATPPVVAAPKVQAHVRYNAAGDALKINLLVPAFRDDYVQVGKSIADQWRSHGAEVNVTSAEKTDFYTKLTNRDYDAVVFGQNLGYNLDTYPFWHSSAADGNGGNLSNLKSSAVNAWLEQTRSSFDTAERRRRLTSLRTALSQEVPAVFLYTPIYHYAVDKNIKNFDLGRIALKRDRLALSDTWYIRQERQVRAGTGAVTFLVWLWGTGLRQN